MGCFYTIHTCMCTHTRVHARMHTHLGGDQLIPSYIHKCSIQQMTSTVESVSCMHVCTCACIEGKDEGGGEERGGEGRKD